MRHTISVLVNDQFGVLARVAGLFASRGYNITSLNVAPTHEPHVSRITVVTEGSPEIVEQINKQLNKLIDVVKVLDLTEVEHVDRELIFIKVFADEAHRAEILRIADIFRGRIIDVTRDSYTLEATGNEPKINALLEMLLPFGIIEIVRTGKVSITRGKQKLTELKTSKRNQNQNTKELP